MPIYLLNEEIAFPPPEEAEEDGLLAVGGDLSPQRLLTAYSRGIFPWYSEDSPILWWSPDPRLILIPDELKVSRSLRQVMQKQVFAITMDRDFPCVIANCAAVQRKGQQGTWITGQMREAYIGLYEAGYAHSVEAWYEGELMGGLYGIALGGAFFGESMFARMSNASKVAFATLVQWLKKRGYVMIDCQVTTSHLVSLGAREVPRSTFMDLLGHALRLPLRKGRWSEVLK